MGKRKKKSNIKVRNENVLKIKEIKRLLYMNACKLNGLLSMLCEIEVAWIQVMVMLKVILKVKSSVSEQGGSISPHLS